MINTLKDIDNNSYILIKNVDSWAKDMILHKKDEDNIFVFDTGYKIVRQIYRPLTTVLEYFQLENKVL